MTMPAANEVRDALRGIIDPEIGINIVELGLIYDVRVDAAGLHVDMTTTSPACPTGAQMLDEARHALLRAFPGQSVDVRRVWEPPWGPERMSDAAKQELGW